MADIEKLGLTEDQGDSSDAAPTGTRQQQFLKQFQWPLAFGPFVLVIVIAQMPIANRLPNWMIFPIIAVPVVWAVAFKGYILYLNYQK
jgi:hypothetical protein